jgi:hypothetical protein
MELDAGRREGSVPELVVTPPDSVSKPQNATTGTPHKNADSKSSFRPISTGGNRIEVTAHNVLRTLTAETVDGCTM